MKKLQKIKNLIINLIVLTIVSTIGCFSFILNSKIHNIIFNVGNIISAKNNLIVHFISVGNADAIAINLPDGKVALIDCGLKNRNVGYTDYLKERVFNTADKQVVDYLILTHADADHIGGAIRLMQEFDVENVALPIINNNKELYLDLLNCVNDLDVKKIDCENANISGKNYCFKFFNGTNSLDTNEMSRVVKLTAFDKSFLFTGDISSDIEVELVEKYEEELNCDVLKVAHHGSKYSTSDKFLSVVTPYISVISCGDNSYGHPTSEVIENLKEVNSKIYRTDIDGNITICVGNDYNLDVLSEDYKIIQYDVKVEVLIVGVNLILLVDSVVIFCKKEKRNLIRA